MSVSIENFVKSIYRQGQIIGGDTKPGTLARMLNITNAAATDMARKLKAKNLIHYEKYQQLSLTNDGKRLALNVLRKHRLWETFLHKTLGLSLHEIHREAEMLEHLTSDFLTDKMDDFLGNPEADPHGDPIPRSDGNISYSNENIVLSKAQANSYYTISRLFSSDKDFFDFCNSNQMTVGTSIKVEKQYESKKMTEINVCNNKILLNQEFTNIIYVVQS